MSFNFVTLNRSLQASNLLTVQEWNALAHKSFNGVSWQTAARKVAAVKGGSMVLKADGSMVVFTLRMNGKISQTTYPDGKWKWV